MCLSNVLWPQPEPPRMTNTSPRLTVKFTLCMRTLPSYPAVKSWTTMMGSAGIDLTLNVEQIVDERKDAVDDDQQDNARDDCPRCGNAGGAGAILRLQPAKAAD